MRVTVRVVPRARRRAVLVQADGTLKVWVTEPADEGRANAAVLEQLADHFGVRRRAVTLVRGQTSRQKLVEIATPEGDHETDRR